MYNVSLSIGQLCGALPIMLMGVMKLEFMIPQSGRSVSSPQNEWSDTTKKFWRCCELSPFISVYYLTLLVVIITYLDLEDFLT